MSALQPPRGGAAAPPPNMYQVPTFNPSAVQQQGGPRARMYPRTPAVQSTPQQLQPQQPELFSPSPQLHSYQQPATPSAAPPPLHHNLPSPILPPAVHHNVPPPVPAAAPPGSHEEHIAYYAQQQPYHHQQEQQQLQDYDQFQQGQFADQFDLQASAEQQASSINAASYPGYYDQGVGGNHYDYQQEQQQLYYGHDQQSLDQQPSEWHHQQQQQLQDEEGQQQFEQQQGEYVWNPELNQWILNPSSTEQDPEAIVAVSEAGQQQQAVLETGEMANNPPDVATAAGHRPPDILLNDPFIPSSDRNLYMQTGQLDGEEGREEEHNHRDDNGKEEEEDDEEEEEDNYTSQEREPVDGGNEEFQAVSAAAAAIPAASSQVTDDLDLPLDRLVLGQQSDQIVTVAAIPASSPALLPDSSRDAAISSPAKVVQPGVMLTSTPTMPEKKKATSVSNDDDEEEVVRSAAVGSDRRDQSVMGPPPSGPAPPSGPRDVTGAADSKKTSNKHGNKKQQPPVESDELDDRESERSSEQKLRSGRHDKKVRRRRRSRSSSDDEEELEQRDSSEEEHYRRRSGKSDKPRDNKGPSSTSSHRKGDRRYYEDHKYRGGNSYREEKSYRDDRSYYEDPVNQSRRSESGRHDSSRYRGPPRYDDRGYYPREPSRPTSRSGSIYEERYFDRSYVGHHHSMYPSAANAYPYYAPAAAAPIMPDRAAMETFEKHWRYYMQNPGLYEQLRLANPAQYESLNNYYRMCGDFLRLPPITQQLLHPNQQQQQPPKGLVTKQQQVGGDQRSSSRASVHSGQSSASESASALHQPNNHYNAQQDSVFQGQQDNYDQLDHHEHHRMTPVKFSSPHVKGVFGALGLLAKVEAKSPLEGQPATVQLHSLQSVLFEQSRELRDFPGPLVPGRTHKGEVIQFCQSKIQHSAEAGEIVDKESYRLIWELLVLLLRQKNAIDGSDIAELLLKGRDVQTPYENGGGEEMESAVESVIRHDRTVVSSSPDSVTVKFRDYLLFGHKKEGLEYAMKHGLWGHALFLASKMDERSYSNVMLRFANGLPPNDPLQTLYQLMSGRQPIAVKECADKNWGDWRPHLAMILSNPSGKEGLDMRSILTLGDTLLERGFLFAAHFCYLMANADFGGYFTDPHAKLVLIGSDRTLQFDAFSTNEAIQCTEIFEYVQKLSNAEYAMPSLQYFKFVYALRLIDHGLSGSALYYLEQIAEFIVKRSQGVVLGDRLAPYEFASQVLTLSDRLKFLDPMYTTREGEVSEMGDPEWLTALRTYIDASQINNAYSYEETSNGYSQQQEYNHSAQQQQYYYDYNQQEQQQSQQPQSDYYEGAEPIMMRPIEEETPSQQNHLATAEEEEGFSASNSSSPSSSSQGSPRHEAANPLLPPPLPQQQQQVRTFVPPPTPKQDNANNYYSNIKTSPPQQQSKPPAPSLPSSSNAQKAGTEQKQIKKPNTQPAISNSGPGMFGRLLGKFIKVPGNQMHLPEDKDQGIVWDEEKKRWVDKNGNPEEESSGAAAPPSDVELSRSNSTADFGGVSMPPPPGPPAGGGNNSNALAPPPMPMSLSGNKFAGGLAKKRGGLAGRIDVFKNSQSAPVLNDGANNMPPPPVLLAPIPADVTLPPPSPPVEESNSAVAAGDAAAPMMFFNPNQFSGSASAVSTTKRNLYAT